jgi:hypothetical protein
MTSISLGTEVTQVRLVENAFRTPGIGNLTALPQYPIFAPCKKWVSLVADN